MTIPVKIIAPKIVEMTNQRRIAVSNRVDTVFKEEVIFRIIKIHYKIDFIGAGYYFM